MSDPVQLSFDEDQAPKLTDWAKEPSLHTLKQDYEAARPAHVEQMGKIERWRSLMKVENAAKPKPVKGRSSVQPKLIRKHAEWRYAALSEPFLGSNKLFKVSPVTWEDAQGAAANELVINNQFNTKINKVKFIDNYIRAAVDEGTVIVRTGWMRVTKMVTEDAPVYEHYDIETQEQLQQLQQALQLEQADPHQYETAVSPELKASVALYKENGAITYAKQVGTQKIKVEKILENRPTVEVLNPQNVYIDPSCLGDVDRALFAIISFETNKAELLKQGKRYKNLDRINWEGNTPLTNPFHETTTPTTFNFQDTARKKVVAYEYWGFYDIHDTGELVPIVATWIGDVMIRMEENPYPDKKIPLAVATYLPIKRDFYGEADAELLEDNQKIIGAVTRGTIDLMGRSANGQRGFAKGLLDPTNRIRYEEGKDYEFNPQQNPNAGGIIEHKYPEIPQSALAMLQLQNQEAEALTGVKSFSGGISGEAYGQVAAGIRGMLDAAAKREMGILRRMAIGVAQVGRKIIAMNQEFLSDQEVVRVTNEQFVTIKREDLSCDCDLDVDISTVEIDNLKAQDMAFMLQTMGPKADPKIAFRIMGDIAELKRMPELAHWLKTYEPKPDPLVEEAKKLEVIKLQKEVELLDSEIALNRAKAAETMSKKDAIDLNYVEQETGTKHARDMQKQQAQSEGNQALQVTKALTTPLKTGEKVPNVEAAIGFNQISAMLSGQNKGPRLFSGMNG